MRTMSECRGCGTWVCVCGWSRVRAARWSPQQCPHCYGTVGHWLPTHHRDEATAQDHAQAWDLGLAKGLEDLSR